MELKSAETSAPDGSLLANMAYLVLARKYRPQTFEEMVGQKGVVRTLRNAIASNRVAQAYLFSGMRGTGKTTAARILAKALNCEKGPTPTPCNACEFCRAIDEDRAIDVLEIDGASNRMVADMDVLRESVKYKPVYARTKVIIVDEVHMLSTHAFNALLKTLEEPPENTVFIFATTQFHDVIPTIVSRCQHFEFHKISRAELVANLAMIASKEGITISPYGLGLIADSADGSVRDAQSALDQAVAFSGPTIADQDLKEILGVIEGGFFLKASSAILDESPAAVFPLVDEVITAGHDLRTFLAKLIEHFRELLLIKTVKEPESLITASPEEMAALRKQAERASAEDFLRYLNALQQSEQALRFSSQPRIYLEALLVRLCQFKKLVPLQDLVRDLRGAQGGSPAGGGDAPGGGSGPRPGPVSRTGGAFGSSPSPAGPGFSRPQPPATPAPRRYGSSLAGASVPPATPASPSAPADAPKCAPAPLTAPATPSSSASPALPPASTPQPTPPPVPAPAQAPAPGSPGALFADALKILQAEKPLVASLLSHFSSVRAGEGTLDILFGARKQDFMKTVRGDLKAVESAVARAFGRRLSVRLLEETTGESAPPARARGESEAALADPTVRSFMDTFKAQVVAIDPVKRPAAGGPAEPDERGGTS